MRRGPDSYSEKKFNCFDSNCDNNTLREKVDSDSSNGCTVHLAAFVLHLRGECIAKQPVEDSFGNILAWNGEIFEGLEVRKLSFYILLSVLINYSIQYHGLITPASKSLQFLITSIQNHTVDVLLGNNSMNRLTNHQLVT